MRIKKSLIIKVASLAVIVASTAVIFYNVGRATAPAGNKETPQNSISTSITTNTTGTTAPLGTGSSQTNNTTNSTVNKPTNTSGSTTSPSGTTGTQSSTTNNGSTVTPTKKRVALSFDDGPHNVYTRGIADELTKYGFHATFFVVGNRVDGTSYKGGDTLTYVLNNGHEVGIHGYTHTAYYNNCSDEVYAYEIGETANAIAKYASGFQVKLMRPISGRITNERLATSPYSIITWSVDAEDWKHKYTSSDTAAQKQAKVDAIVENVMSSVKDGSIVLMHDIYESSYDAVKVILERLNAEGYEVVTVSELLGNPEPGVKYTGKY